MRQIRAKVVATRVGNCHAAQSRLPGKYHASVGLNVHGRPFTHFHCHVEQRSVREAQEDVSVPKGS
jgi:hypothetical protein